MVHLPVPKLAIQNKDRGCYGTWYMNTFRYAYTEMGDQGRTLTVFAKPRACVQGERYGYKYMCTCIPPDVPMYSSTSSLKQDDLNDQKKNQVPNLILQWVRFIDFSEEQKRK